MQWKFNDFYGLYYGYDLDAKPKEKGLQNNIYQYIVKGLHNFSIK